MQACSPGSCQRAGQDIPYHFRHRGDSATQHSLAAPAPIPGADSSPPGSTIAARFLPGLDRRYSFSGCQVEHAQSPSMTPRSHLMTSLYRMPPPRRAPRVYRPRRWHERPSLSSLSLRPVFDVRPPALNHRCCTRNCFGSVGASQASLMAAVAVSTLETYCTGQPAVNS